MRRIIYCSIYFLFIFTFPTIANAENESSYRQNVNDLSAKFNAAYIQRNYNVAYKVALELLAYDPASAFTYLQLVLAWEKINDDNKLDGKEMYSRFHSSAAESDFGDIYIKDFAKSILLGDLCGVEPNKNCSID